ncbi:MAG: SsrA-binding protein SmpB [Oscillospiraceae bacterium]|nr:SsrA-binding protein SmpB [Oscillospiraceae bacterium]
MSQSHKVSIQNRQARHEYEILETFEAGIALCGTEVKSVRAGGVNLKEAFCVVDKGQLVVKQMHIAPYEKGNVFNRDPVRPRVLLMHKSEIRKLAAQVGQKGLTIVPLAVYSKQRLIKVSVGLCRGKRLHDKRDDAAKRVAERDMQRIIKERNT